MKINWSLMNRLGLLAPEDDDFSSFTPGGKGEGAGNSDDDGDDNNANDDDDDDFIENGDDDDDDDDLDLAPAGNKPQKRAPVTMDPEALVRSILAAQQQPKDQPQLTEAELQQRLGRPQISPELVAMIRNPEVGPEKVVELLAGLLDGNYKYAMTTTQHLMRLQMQPLLQMQQEWAQHQQQQRTQAFVKDLTSTYGALKKFPSAVTRAIEELSGQGFTGKGMPKEQILKTVAKRARAIIRQIVPEFSLKAQPNNTQRQAGSGFPRRAGKTQPGISRERGPASFDHIL